MAKPIKKLFNKDNTIIITGVSRGIGVACGRVRYERDKTRNTLAVSGINLPDNKGVIKNIPVNLLIIIAQFRNCVSTNPYKSIILLL